MKSFTLAVCACLATQLLLAAPVGAVDGYFSHGYGTQSKGMAGASLAYPKDSLALATNPASAIALGDRFDIDMDKLELLRQGTYQGNAAGPDTSFGGNGRKNFYVPELGYIRTVGKDWAMGIIAYGNGGLDTNYPTNPYGRFGAVGKAADDLMQVFVSPTVAYRITDDHSIGLSLNIMDELLKIQGLSVFAPFSSNPAALSDRGRDSTLGYGVRLGWQGRVTPWLVLGASWQSKTYAGHLEKYAGLMAGQGTIDAPATYGVGAAVTPLPGLDIALDLKRIDFSAAGGAGANDFQRILTGHLLGATDGPGFGWKDTKAIKIGFNYRIDGNWQVRTGYCYSTPPTQANQTLFGFMAPGTIGHQVTAGATWTPVASQEISVYALYDFTQSINGSNSIPPAFGGGEVNVRAGLVGFGIGYGWKF